MPYIGNIVQDFSVNTAMLNSDSVTSIKIDDGTIVNADINDSAAIAGTKISPDFGSQAIATTGSATIGTDLIHAGDTDTKLSFGTDTISVATNGVTRMTFTGNFIDLPDAGTLRLGNSNDFKISHGSGGASNIEHSNTSQPLKISATGAGNIALLTNSNERMRIDSSGNVLVGLSSTLSSNNAKLQVAHTDGNADIIVHRAGNNANPPSLNFQKTRNASIGNYGTIVQDDDELGSIRWGGADGSNIGFAARIVGAVDGTPGANDMPGRIQFHTSADGGEDLTERMRITSTGLVGIGETNPAGSLHINAASGVDGPVFESGGTNNTSHALIVRDSGANQLLRVENNGRVLLGTSTSNTSDRFTIVDPGNAFMSIRSDAAADNTIQSLDFAVGTAVRSSTNLTAVIKASIHSQSGGTLKSDLMFSTNAGNSITEHMRIDSVGRVQIGSTNNSSTGTKFVVGSGNNMAATALINTQDTDIKALQLSNWDGNATTHKVMIGFDNSGHGGFDIGMPAQSADFAFQASGGERMRITGAGNVGIGTTSPDDLLEVSSTTADKRLLLTKANSGTAHQSGMTMHFQNYGPSGTARNDGTLIGRIRFSASQPTSGGLQDAGAIECRADTQQTGNSTRSRLSFLTVDSQTATERMRIDKDGRVIIGYTEDLSGGDTSALLQVTHAGGGTFRLVRDDTSIASNDNLGRIHFSGRDGGANVNCAEIIGKAIGTHTTTSRPTAMLFNTTPSGSATPQERMRIQEEGGISFNGDSAQANALDDYEEGTWTPNPTESGNNVATSHATGRYVKIGAMVYAFWRIDVSTTSAGGHMILTGLPFTNSSTVPATGGTAMDYQTYHVENGPILHVPNSQSNIQFYKNSGQNFNANNASGKSFRGCTIFSTA